MTQYKETREQKPNIFVIMPFLDDHIAVYEELKRIYAEKYEFTYAGDLDSQENILQDIVHGINQADVIIADVTGLNANVFYELGLAHAMNKKVIIITQDLEDLPFDIKSYRAIEYSMLFYKFKSLQENLDKLLAGALSGEIRYGNPVVDFIPDYFRKANIDGDLVMHNESTLVDTDEGEAEEGFLDRLAHIEENSNSIAEELVEMSREMDSLSNSVEKTTADINKVKVQGGQANVNFVRNTCRKLATPVESFADKVNKHNSTIDHCWEMVENNYLLLLENKYIKDNNNEEDLKGSIRSLEELQKTIDDSNDAIEEFINVLEESTGVERRLNKAVNKLVKELSEYLSITDRMASSVDRIVAKSTIVLEQLG